MGMTDSPDLTRVEVIGVPGGEDEFLTQMKAKNPEFYNFMHHLLLTGWVDRDWHTSTHGPASSPFLGRLLTGETNADDWTEAHKEQFRNMIDCFVGLHKSGESKSVPAGDSSPRFTLSQIQHIPETIRRCIENCVDKKAEQLLGKLIADEIDICRLLRETHQVYDSAVRDSWGWVVVYYGGCLSSQERIFSKIDWMACLGVGEGEFEPLESFDGYNPQHERDTIDHTALVWGDKKED